VKKQAEKYLSWKFFDLQSDSSEGQEEISRQP